MRYEEREFCELSGEALEDLVSYDFPIFCGATEQEFQKDIVARQEWAISRSGIVQLKKLLPLELLYANGHDAGNVGELWEEHHRAFASFVVEDCGERVLEIGGGHGKLARNALRLNSGLKWTIVEPNSAHKMEGVSYIDGFFRAEILNEGFDAVISSHLFEHLYHPGAFLRDCYSAGGGGGDVYLFAQHAKVA